MFREKQRTHTVTALRGRRAPRPANVFAAVVGIFLITLGSWALIKTGLNTDHIFTPTKEVLGLPHTPTLALGEIGFGILLVFAAATRAFGTFLIALLGAASLAFGVIVLSDSWSGRVHRWTAANHDNGWMFILIGAVFVLAAILPLLVATRIVQIHETTAPEPEPVAAEPEPTASSDTTADREARPLGIGAASQTQTETAVDEPDNVSAHAG